MKHEHKYELSRAINREICKGRIITRKTPAGRIDRITGAEVKRNGTLIAYCENGFSMIQDGIIGVKPSKYDKDRVDWLLMFACSLSITNDGELAQNNLIDEFIDKMVDK